ncbi:MAG: nucleoid-associated protein EbfC [Clostridiales bacterium]|jgi:DNA-binding YbaB/EbfC family protein|nr:nucleoid-associated protein EbfC [Clostridiales bacterium]
MAKGRGPKIPGNMNNMNNMMKQVQKMQRDMQQTQETIEQETFEATAGGGAIRIKANGKKEILEIELKPEVVDPDDIEMLQDLIIVATNEVLKTVEDETNKRMSKYSSGLGMPGLF